MSEPRTAAGRHPDGAVTRAVGVTRRFGELVALDGVDLSVGTGELLGLLGPNGAGKTTLLSLLVGLRRPDRGQVELLGGDPRDPGRRRELGVTPQETALPPTLRVREVVDFVARHYPDPLPARELLARVGLSEVAGRQCGGLSGGQRRRLAVGLAFVGRPRLVVLDEPTTGLDVEARRALWDTIREFHAAGGTVLLTSHYLEEVSALAGRVVVLGGGRVVADGTVDDIRGAVARQRVSFTLPGPDGRDDGRAGPGSLPARLPGVLAADRRLDPDAGVRHDLYTADADELVRALVAAGVPFRGLAVAAASLEEAFLALTTDREMS